jgi:aminoglycoside phosphotransferase (APT) family kinase protein
MLHKQDSQLDGKGKMYMDQKDNAISREVIYEVLSTQKIDVNEIELCHMNGGIITYIIDRTHLLRIADSIPAEIGKLERVKSVPFTPKVYTTGSFTLSGQDYDYMITDYMEGSELFGTLKDLTEEESLRIGEDIAGFLLNLQTITDSSYDIGHYIPTIPRYRSSWKEGHVEYIRQLRDNLSGMRMNDSIIASAFDYIEENINCLEYQAGAKLLHNDFHPKNIIVREGRLAGVIDWECSQFGEADFELVHLFHWCIYPPEAGCQFEALLKSLITTLGIIDEVPMLAKRLTIYQLEHELNQLIWNGERQLEERRQRIHGWLNGQVEVLFDKWKLD